MVSAEVAVLGFAFRCSEAGQAAAVALLGGELQRGLHKRLSFLAFVCRG